MPRRNVFVATVLMSLLVVALSACGGAPAARDPRAPAEASTAAAARSVAPSLTPTVTTATTTTATAAVTQPAASASPGAPMATAPTPAPTPTAPPRPTPSPAPSPVAHVALIPGAPAQMAPGDIGDLGGAPAGRSLRFVAVTADSRCPADVRCVWAGEANLAFDWTTAVGTRRIAIAVGAAGGAAALEGDLRLRVIELLPAPRAGVVPAPDDYRATVLIESGPASSGLAGRVAVSPTCPVERVDMPCPPRPIAATLSIHTVGGPEVARVASDTAGRFGVTLAPGLYTVIPLPIGTAALPRGIPVDVQVTAGAWTIADIAYDSGIR